MRVFRIAVPTRNIAKARRFYEEVLGVDADDTVPTRLYFHCGDVIVALIDWSVEGRSEFAPIPDNLYFAVDDIEAVFRCAVAAKRQRLSTDGKILT